MNAKPKSSQPKPLLLPVRRANFPQGKWEDSDENRY